MNSDPPSPAPASVHYSSLSHSRTLARPPPRKPRCAPLSCFPRVPSFPAAPPASFRHSSSRLQSRPCACPPFLSARKPRLCPPPSTPPARFVSPPPPAPHLCRTSALAPAGRSRRRTPRWLLSPCCCLLQQRPSPALPLDECHPPAARFLLPATPTPRALLSFALPPSRPPAVPVGAQAALLRLCPSSRVPSTPASFRSSFSFALRPSRPRRTVLTRDATRISHSSAARGGS